MHPFRMVLTRLSAIFATGRFDMADDDKASWDRFRVRMEAIPKAVRRNCEPAVIKSANELANKMKENAPKRTGKLAESIAVTLPGEITPPYSQPGGAITANELEALVTVGNDKVRYPHLVEYGTSKAPAQPFFWPSARELQKRIKARLKRTVKKAVESTR